MELTLIAWLNTELQERGWTHRELARRANVSQSAVSSVLAGQRNAGWDFCAAIARALGKPPEEVFRLAKLLPPLAPAVAEERETLSILRGLPADLRALAIRLLRSMQPGQPGSRLAETAEPYQVEPPDPYLAEIGQLWDQVPDWKKRDVVAQIRLAVEEQHRTNIKNAPAGAPPSR
jgi:transcriptional regulator with XRE-family HTH domain